MRWVRPRLTTGERALLVALVLLALAQDLLCAVAPDQVVRACSLAACVGASAYAACLVLAARR
jgi:hypothetical protein